MASTDKFLVMAKSFNYDDQYYTMTDGGNPVVYFSNYEEAKAYCRFRNVSAMAGTQLNEYGEDPDWYLNPKFTAIDVLWRFIEVFGYERMGIDSDVDVHKMDKYDAAEHLQIPGDITPEEYERIEECLSLEFYEVMSVSKGKTPKPRKVKVGG